MSSSADKSPTRRLAQADPAHLSDTIFRPAFRSSSSRLLKKSPRAGFEAGFIAIMEADLAGERAVIVKFCKAVAAGFVHFVVTLPGEVGAAGRVGAIEAGGDATEEELARSLAVEGNVGGLEHVEEVGAPHLHRRDAPFAFQACSARHDGAAMSLGRRIRL